MRDRVHLLGFIPEEHLYAIYAAASLYVVPSHLESGYSYPALEALTAGTPVLLNKADMYSYASEGEGVYFFDGRVKAGYGSFAETLADLLMKSDFARVDPSKCDVLGQFSWDRVKQAMRTMYSRP